MKNAKTTITTLLLAGSLLLSGATPMAYATDDALVFPYMDEPDEVAVLSDDEYGDYIVDCYARISMSASGCTYSGYVKGNAQTTRILARLFLLENAGNGWTQVEMKETTTTASSHVCSMSDFSTQLVSGRAYKARYRAWVYSGDDYDYEAKYSPIVYAP